MNKQQLETVLTVVRTGSLTKAGAELFLSVPGVKSRIDTLEQELGVALFERTKRGVF